MSRTLKSVPRWTAASGYTALRESKSRVYFSTLLVNPSMTRSPFLTYIRTVFLHSSPLSFFPGICSPSRITH